MRVNGVYVPRINGPLVYRVCCVCKKLVGIDPGYKGDDHMVSHCYCKPCLKKTMDRIEERACRRGKIEV